MHNGIATATRILLVITVITVFAFVAQVTSLVFYGPTHDYWELYLVLMVIMLVTSLVSQWIVRKSLFAGMNFFAWICFACIAGMVCIDFSTLKAGFPLILFVLGLGVLGLGLTVGYSGSVPYGAVCAVGVLGAGVISGDIDSGIVAAAFISAVVAMSSEHAGVVKRLDRLENAVDVYTEAKQAKLERRQASAAHYGGSAGAGS